MFDVTTEPRRLALRMSACLSNIDEADGRLRRFLEEAGADLDLFAVRILLREGLLNAVMHGSQEDPDLDVMLEACLDRHGLRLTIEDAGPGFCWEPALHQLDIMGDSGRGLPLMRMYASTVEFNERGNRVVLIRDFGQFGPYASEQGVVG